MDLDGFDGIFMGIQWDFIGINLDVMGLDGSLIRFNYQQWEFVDFNRDLTKREWWYDGDRMGHFFKYLLVIQQFATQKSPCTIFVSQVNHQTKLSIFHSYVESQAGICLSLAVDYARLVYFNVVLVMFNVILVMSRFCTM